MDSLQAITIIRDTLRDNLDDPIVLAGGTRGTGVEWIYADEPVSLARYPSIQIEKIDNPTSVISIGSDYWEQEYLVLNIWFYTKNGFKIIVSGKEYLNATLVEYYQGVIKTTLKSKFNTLYDSGVLGYRHLNTSRISYDPNTQLYMGAVTIRVQYFISGC